MMLTPLLQVFLIAVVPITLIKLDLISVRSRLLVLFSVFALVVGIILFERIPAMSLGIRSDNIAVGAPWYVFVTAAAICILFFVSKLVRTKRVAKWHKDPHFLFLFIPISVAQQFLFQGFVLYKLGLVFSAPIAVLCTALLFGYMHTIYPRPLFSMSLGLIGGLAFGTLYMLFPSLVLASATHAVLNFAAVYLGLFTLTDEKGVPQHTRLSLTRH